MALGEKRIETRSWATKYRGPLAIHAAKGGLGVRELNAFVLSEPLLKTALMGQTLTAGCIVAVVNLRDCATTNSLYQFLSAKERKFGDYAPGRFGWLTENLFRLPEPIPYKGSQGLGIVSPGVVEMIRAQREQRP